MAWQVILPLAASLLQGAVAGGTQASQAARENQRQDLAARMRRSELQPIIDRLRSARDHFGMDEQFVRDFSRASNQMEAQSAQSGMTNAGSGGVDQVRGDLLASGLAQMAQAKVAQEQQDQQLLAQILSDPSLYAGVGESANPTSAGILGALGGGLGGLGSTLNSFLSTEEGLAALGGLFGLQGGPAGPTTVADNGSLVSGLGGWLSGQAGGGATARPLMAPTPQLSLRNPTGQQGGPPSPSAGPIYNPSRRNPYYFPG